jgi:cell division protein FtsQ
MSRNQKIFRFAIRATALFAVLALFIFINQKRRNFIVTDVKVQLPGDTTLKFLTEEDVLGILKDKQIPFKGTSLSDLNVHAIESAIQMHPAVKEVTVWNTQDGILSIEVIQRNPVLRVMDLLNDNYYIDEEGNFMPAMPNFTARVPVANGFITDRFHQKNMSINEVLENDSLSKSGITDDLFKFISLIRQDSFLTALTEQFYVNMEGEIEIVPKAGPETILLGDALDAEDKLNRMRLFYTKGLPSAGWNTYKSINLKYKEQIICTKKTL